MITRVAKGLLSIARPNHHVIRANPRNAAPRVHTAARRRVPMPVNRRTPEQVRRHYEVEKELASRLRRAPRKERRRLYTELYDELYRRVQDHPQLTWKMSPEDTAWFVQAQMDFISSFLRPRSTFLEVGAGACSLSLEVAKHVERVHAVDVSDEITNGFEPPANFELCLSDGCSIPVPPGSIDVAYSNQLMEHLHPDDALEQLSNIFLALKPGGVYICRTPNALTGPHDVSAGFDRISTGMHLKEYTVAELAALFRAVGFSRVKLAFATSGRYRRSPLHLTILLERMLAATGRPQVRSSFLRRVLRALLGIRLLGIK